MTSLATDRPFECAPHAIRTFAMALTLGMNLAIVLFALRPTTQFEIQAPPPASLLATILQPVPPTPPSPTVPTLHAVKRVARPNVEVAAPHPAPLTVQVTQPLTPVQVTAAAAPVAANPAGASGNSDATIAYETATPPDYPIQALRAGMEGTVLLKVLVDTHGKPERVVVSRSSGSRVLDEAALRHVLAAWRFHPAIRDGHAIEAWALVPVRFDLQRR
ncbi:MAG TPA: energy transducer TonB [Rhodanobacteraceae bacterium]|nr:energy transducer TonB [Rhodanobacteraceae bacterium]